MLHNQLPLAVQWLRRLVPASFVLVILGMNATPCLAYRGHSHPASQQLAHQQMLYHLQQQQLHHNYVQQQAALRSQLLSQRRTAHATLQPQLQTASRQGRSQQLTQQPQYQTGTTPLAYQQASKHQGRTSQTLQQQRQRTTAQAPYQHISTRNARANQATQQLTASPSSQQQTGITPLAQLKQNRKNNGKTSQGGQQQQQQQMGITQVAGQNQKQKAKSSQLSQQQLTPQQTVVSQLGQPQQGSTTTQVGHHQYSKRHAKSSPLTQLPASQRQTTSTGSGPGQGPSGIQLTLKVNFYNQFGDPTGGQLSIDLSFGQSQSQQQTGTCQANNSGTSTGGQSINVANAAKPHAKKHSASLAGNGPQSTQNNLYSRATGTSVTPTY